MRLRTAPLTPLRPLFATGVPLVALCVAACSGRAPTDAPAATEASTPASSASQHRTVAPPNELSNQAGSGSGLDFSPLVPGNGPLGPFVFQPIFWSSSVARDIQAGAYSAISAVVRDANVAYLKEYAHGGYDPSAGSMVFSPITITPTVAYQRVGDDEIVKELNAQFVLQDGPLQNHGNSSRTVFVVFLPPSIANGGAGCAHHAAGVSTANPTASITFPYIEMPDSVRTCNGLVPEVLTGYQAITLGLSHEIIETLTDPIPGTGWTTPKPDGGTGGPEIGDKCQPLATTVLGADGVRTLAQQEWSNAYADSHASGCITGQAATPLSIIQQSSTQVSAYWAGEYGQVHYSYWTAGANQNQWVQDVKIATTICSPFCFEQGAPIAAVPTLGNGEVNVYGATYGGIERVRYRNATGWEYPTQVVQGGPPSIAPITAVNAQGVSNPANDGTVRLFWIDSGGGVNEAVDNGTFLASQPAPPSAGAIPGSTVAAAVSKPGGVSLFWTDSAGAIWSVYYDCWPAQTCTMSSGAWSSPFKLYPTAGAPPGSPVTAVSSQANGVSLFWTHEDGTIWTAYYVPGGWSGIQSLYGPGTTYGGKAAAPGQAITAVSTTPSGVSLFWTASDSSIQGGYFEPLTKYGRGWHAPFAVAPTASAFANPNTPITAAANVAGVDRQVGIFWEGAGGSALTAYYAGLGSSWSPTGSIAGLGAVVP